MYNMYIVGVLVSGDVGTCTFEDVVMISVISCPGSNPQYSLKIHSPVHKPLVWVLLTRHITTKARYTLHVHCIHGGTRQASDPWTALFQACYMYICMYMYVYTCSSHQQGICIYIYAYIVYTCTCTCNLCGIPPYMYIVHMYMYMPLFSGIQCTWKMVYKVLKTV